MSTEKLTYAEKVEIVERLKENLTPIKYLNRFEARIIKELKKRHAVLRLCGTGTGDWVTSNCTINQCDVFRIHRDYTLPIEAEEGFRLVTGAEERDFDYPADCEVRFFDDYERTWHQSSMGAGFGKDSDGSIKAWAVPADYVFKQAVPGHKITMRHVMIDLETLGSDYDGVFTVIGACEFDPETGQIGRKFHRHVNQESSIATGRTITPDSIKWWMNQSEEARKEIMQDGDPLVDVLKYFAEWLPERPIVWGNGPTFDIGKLENAFGYYSIPWEFHDIRCVRTIRHLASGLVDRDSIEFVGEKHNAIADAIHQAKYVSAMWQALTK